MSKLWFAAKRYGYGWYPVTWQGWAVTIGYVVLLLAPSAAASVAGTGGLEETTYAWLFAAYAAVLTAILLAVCFKKGEPARWRWGGK